MSGAEQGIEGVPGGPGGPGPFVPVTGVYALGTTVVESDQAGADTFPRFSRDASGKLQWGPGNGALDSTLRRAGASSLVTDGFFSATSSVTGAQFAATATAMGAVGPAGQSGITFQSGEAGSNLYRSAAGQIRTDGQLVVVGTLFAAAGGFNIAAGTYAGGSAVGGTMSYGTGAPNNANGTNGDFYFRVDGGALTTVYQRRAGAWVGIV